MVQGDDTRYFHVRLTVPRRDGWRQWGAARGEFGRELAGQESTTVIGPRVDSEVRRREHGTEESICSTRVLVSATRWPGPGG